MQRRRALCRRLAQRGKYAACTVLCCLSVIRLGLTDALAPLAGFSSKGKGPHDLPLRYNPCKAAHGPATVQGRPGGLVVWPAVLSDTPQPKRLSWQPWQTLSGRQAVSTSCLGQDSPAAAGGPARLNPPPPPCRSLPSLLFGHGVA